MQHACLQEGHVVQADNQVDASFIEEKLRNIADLLSKCVDLSEAKEREEFLIYKNCFDEVIERLSASNFILSQVKFVYERVINNIECAESLAKKQTEKLHLKKAGVGTVKNYRQRLQELDDKLESISEDNERIRHDIEKLREERTKAAEEREKKLEYLRQSKPRMNSSKRSFLGLSVDEITDLSKLQDELQKVRLELQETLETTNKRFVPKQCKYELQQQLQDKEALQREVSATKNKHQTVLEKLRTAVEAVKLYGTRLEVDRTEVDLPAYILQTIQSSVEHSRDHNDDSADDPEKEREAEMILECYEKFSKLMQNEQHEEAALVAANSPKGVLRNIETLLRFKAASNTSSSERLPLLSYCEALMESAPAYTPISLDEAIECTKFILQQDKLSKLAYWIVQGYLPSSTAIARLLYHHCQCFSGCDCGAKSLSFIMFENCEAYKEAALCLIQQERYMAFLSFGRKVDFTIQDYAKVLCKVPSMKFALVLISPPSPVFTVFEVMHLLLRIEHTEVAINVFKEFAKMHKANLSELIHKDECTGEDTWKGLVVALQERGHNELALNMVSALTVKAALVQAKKALLHCPNDLASTTKSDVKNEEPEQVTPGSSCESLDEQEESCSGTGYSSSSEESEDELDDND